MEDDLLRISPPLYLIGMKIECWKCGERMPVIAFLAKLDLAEDIEREICVLSDVVTLPEDVLGYVQKRVPTFQLRYSKTVQGKYYANTCPSCGMLSGDFFLHSEPGAPFFPTCEEEAGLLFLTEIPISSPVYIDAGLHGGTAELILEHAKKIA
ncbi:hypothetical protein [Undibacterium sp.]|uniref:hypothetical protein n=1 Tax=Undibacterium sp. TaxID=1914977 RepID=UPI003752938E